MMISASAGTSRSTVMALAVRMGTPARAPATVISSWSMVKLLRAGVDDHRRRADDDGAGHLLPALTVFAPMDIAASAADARRHAHP